ncbi:BGTF surface domain-containing protein [Halobellus captivus]|uniref:BGTF surface domain-containing protein n=1 Tax=Halobellus captivus TaxID=2592614 RepID=UPI00119FCEEB|nr:BGTF surface domain-containing protein [Halobellus captivus]
MPHAPTPLVLAIAISLLLGSATPVSGLGIDADREQRVQAVGDAPSHVSAEAAATSETANPIRRQVDDDSGSFPDGNVSVTRGDEVTIAVSHSAAATVTIGGPEYGFHVTVNLGGSGTDEIVIDTRRTTDSDPNAFIDGGSATMHTPPLDEPIEPEDYLVRVDVDGVERDVSTLTVEPRGDLRAESFRAPGSFEPAESAGGGEDGDADVGPLQSTMTAGSAVARGDYAVMRVEESGLETALNASDLTGSAAANGLKVNFTQTDPGPNHAAREYVATDSANVTVLPNLANDELYVLWDTSDVELESQSERNRYRAALTLTEESGLSDGSETVATATFFLREPRVSLSPANDSVHYPWDDDAFPVTGSTTRAPNTELEVRLRSTDPNAFLELADATVDENGEFEASFDFSGLSRGTNATLWVRDHFLETAQEVHLVAPDPMVDIENQTVNGTAVEIERAEVPSGGFVRLEDEGGEAIGRSDYLAPGQHANVSAELETVVFEDQLLRAELVRADEDGSYDPSAAAYALDGVTVNDTAMIDFPPAPTETATLTRTETETGTPTATAYPVVTRTPLQPGGTTESSLPLSPGVAVAALVGAAALLARRGDAP